MEAQTWFVNDWFLGSDFRDGNIPLPIMLMNEGYDVWLGNYRGTKYSLKHKTLDSSDKNSDYWKFSMAEKGMLDVPAAIKQIQKTSNVEKVAYMGFS